MPDYPDFRLTVRRGTVLAIDWRPWLTTGGPMMTMLRARGRAGVAIADVIVLRENDVATEAVVHFLAGDSAAARETIVAWARDVGYRRVWLHDEPVELPGPAEHDADTRCNGCAIRLYDGGPAFWEHVRELGRFPGTCALCGSDLPQWRIRHRPLAATDPTDIPTATMTGPCR
jgi:hypothetical protein